MIKSELVVRVRASDTIDATVRRMASDANRVRHVGVAVVLGEDDAVVGVVTDGDIRRAYANDIPFGRPVSQIMSADPVSVAATLPFESVPAEVLRRIRQGGRLKADIVRHVLVTDAAGRLLDIYDSLAVFAHGDRYKQWVAV
jgi:CBS domain-containing protein